MTKILLTKLQCIVNDEIDEDEVFLKYKGEKIWPDSGRYKGIDTSETFDVNVTIENESPEEPIVVELWDFDFLSTNDFLGTFTMKIGSDTEGSFSTSMALKEEGSTASYILYWEIL